MADSSGQDAFSLLSASDLRILFKELHNFIYANDSIKQHARVFQEVMKLLFLKLYSEQVRGANDCFIVTQVELSQSQQNGASESFIQRIQKGFRAAASNPIMQGVFGPTDHFELSPYVLARAVDALQRVSFADADSKGIAFQAIVGPQLRTEQGQFFTPEPAKRLMIEICEPSAHEILVDPACGSGGLLIQAREHRPRESSAPQPTVYGLESERELVRIARLYMILMGDGHDHIFEADSLSNWKDLTERTNGVVGPEIADVIVTNPPFGSRAAVTKRQTLANFPHLGNRHRQAPEILFIERIIQLLKPGGRAGIVLPSGVLANSSTAYVRNYIRATCQIVAVVSLPDVTFRLADVGIKSLVLFLRKWGSPDHPSDYPTFRAISHKVGYDARGRQVRSRATTGERNEIGVDEDITAIINEWHDFRKRHDLRSVW